MKRRDEIRLTAEERDAFLALPNACTLATVRPSGYPQLTAMWFVMIDGVFHFETHRNSRKVKNLQQNPRCAVLIEDGKTYSELRGYSVEGEGEVVADPRLVFRVTCEVAKRYTGFDPVASEPEAEQRFRAHSQKRVVIRVRPVREMSWDHRKLGGGY